MSFLSKLFGDANARYLKTLQPLVEQTNQLEPEYRALSDQELTRKTLEFKDKLIEGKTLDDLLPDAFAAAREASWRALGMRHFDVQLLGGIVLHRGQIAEMRTGEGKTLVATLPVYLNALEGKGVHLVTVNDYLARRDAGWMGQVYHALGLTTAVIAHDLSLLYDPAYTSEQEHDPRLLHLRPVSRREAYQADITYGTNNEFGFDYLRDNMVVRPAQMSQRPLSYAIVDEVDSILIDEARTPLIISAPAQRSADLYQTFAKLVPRLRENEDYNVDEKMRAATLNEAGISKMEQWLGVANLYADRFDLAHHLEQALKAHALFRRDRDYVVKEDEVIIVDEFTGRLMPGRRYSEGLHQAIEAKEGVQVQEESQTLATVTFQNYFRLYRKLAGMTGTAATESEEFAKIYKLDVTVIPTHRPMVRQDANDLVYRTASGKYQAVAAEIKERHAKNQPVLVGTVSIEKSELLASLLSQEGIEHQVLNAKNHAREAEIIAQAGRAGSVTIATNMAGRGVDIILGGNPPDEAEAALVRQVGGLHVIGTERHEARRIDNQLRGRSGRQGDPGSSRFYLSLEDDLMRIFGSERLKSMMTRLGVPEDVPIEHGLVSKSIEQAQKKVEGHNFDLRKHLVEYDDVVNKHREAIYRKRRQALELGEHNFPLAPSFERRGDEALRASLDVVTDEREGVRPPPLGEPALSDDEPREEESKGGAGEVSLRSLILDLVDREIESVVNFHTAETNEAKWDVPEVFETFRALFGLPESAKLKLAELWHAAGSDQQDQQVRSALISFLRGEARQVYEGHRQSIEQQFGPKAFPEIEKGIYLRSIDTLWIEHLEALDHLRAGIGLQGYGQRDPLVEYKRQSYQLFQQLLAAIQRQVAASIFQVAAAQRAVTSVIRQQPAESDLVKSPLERQGVIMSGASESAAGGGFQSAGVEVVADAEGSLKPKDAEGHKVGRNDPCPCGSGKKYKKCHGA